MVIEKDSHCCWPVLVLDGPTLSNGEQRETANFLHGSLNFESPLLPFLLTPARRVVSPQSVILTLSRAGGHWKCKDADFHTNGATHKKKWTMGMSSSTAASQQAQNTFRVVGQPKKQGRCSRVNMQPPTSAVTLSLSRWQRRAAGLGWQLACLRKTSSAQAHGTSAQNLSGTSARPRQERGQAGVCLSPDSLFDALSTRHSSPPQQSRWTAFTASLPRALRDQHGSAAGIPVVAASLTGLHLLQLTNYTGSRLQEYPVPPGSEGTW